MLPDQLRLLISAYSADELSPRRKRAAQRLLKHSAEARALLIDIRSDARQLRHMPRHLAPPNLVETVLSRLPENRIIVRPVLPRATRWPALVGTSVAAGFMLAVCASVWLILTLPHSAIRNDQSTARIESHTSDITVATKDSSTPATPAANSVEPKLPETRAVAANSPPAPQLPAPAEKTPVAASELASPPLVLPEPARVMLPRLPEFYTAHSLDQNAVKASVAQELAKSESHRIDLFCKDGGRALDRLQAAFKERGVRVTVDAQAAETLKRKMREFYAVYCDDLTAAEWNALLQSLGKNDRKAEEKKPGDGTLDQLVLMPLGSSDQKDLVGLLGVDPTVVPPKATGTDPRRPISEDTADQVAKAIGKSDAAKGQKQALVIPFWPVRALPATSKEIRQFIESNRDRRPDTIAVFFIVRFPI